MSILWDKELRERRAAMWRSIWPAPPVNFFYLGVVADEVGVILFPGEWSPVDMALPPGMPAYIDPSPDRRHDTSNQALSERMQADLALRRHGHARPGSEAIYSMVEICRRGDARADDYACLTFTEDEWLLASELLRNEDLHTLLAFKRARGVQRLIAEAAERSDVRISYRHKDGGHTRLTEAHWWSTPHLSSRFQSYSINPERPFSPSRPDTDNRHDLFVHKDDRAKLMVLARSASGAEEVAPITAGNVPTDVYLSPYMQLAIEVIREAEISPIKHSKVDLLISIIQSKMRNRGLPESANLAKSIATIVRPPEAQLGKAKAKP